MIRDITLGQYYDTESAIHKMDPRTKILYTIFYMVILFLLDSVYEYIAILVLTAGIIKISNIPLKFMLKGLKPIVLLVIITAMLNLFMTPGEPIFEFGFLKISREGIFTAMEMAVRIILLIVGSSVLTLTTTPTVLTGGMEILLTPLKKIGIPVSAFVMMISIALRFIPTLIDETDKIIKAQTSRGADFENKNPIKKIKAFIPILIPLFVSAFRRADELAVAMECRCYDSDSKRTSFRKFKFKRYDVFALLSAVFFVGIIGCIKVVL